MENEVDQGGVPHDDELRRIEALPSRPQDWTPEYTQEAIDLVTKWLKLPGGRMVLKAIQARALVEAYNVGKLVGEIGAGAGKTLLSLLLFTVWQAQRGLLLVPAGLREKTFDDYAVLKEHWQLLPLIHADDFHSGPHIRLLSYESLSTIRFATFLDEFRPDVIVADEAHKLSRVKNSRGKRFFRYIREARKSDG
jgi:hypothetical protein